MAESRAILKTLEGKVRGARISIFYQFGLLLVAIAMIILPLVYLAMIGAAGYGLYEYAINGVAIFKEVHRPRQAEAALFVYLVPLLAGAVLILFMIKPLLAPMKRGIPSRALKPEDQPLLFEFIKRLCTLMGAPVPRRIEVNCEVNASASLRPGLASLIVRDLTLCIGLPLAGGLNLRQFTGVLAHEFGHFSQGFAMRLSYLIHSVNLWFARVVYERDAWDEWLRTCEREADIRVKIFFWLIMLMVWVTRRVLWVLMMIGHLISSFMSRQMEYDADRNAARVVGSKGISDALGKLRLLYIAWQKSISDLGQAWEEKRLGDNLPMLIDNNYEQMPEDLRDKIREQEMKERTGIFDTHPAAKKRLRKLEKLNEEGLLRDEAAPATCLFAQYDELCRDISMDFYAATLGPAAVHSTFVPTQELIGRRETIGDSFVALREYCFGCFLFTRMIGPDPELLARAPEDPRAVAAELQRARAYLQQAIQVVRPAFKRYRKGWQITLAGFAVEQQFQAGIHARGISAEVAASMLESGTNMKQDAEMEIAAFEDGIRRRLTSSLRLLHAPQLRQRIPEAGDMLRQAHKIAIAIEGMLSVSEAIEDLIRCHQGLSALLAGVKGREEDERMITRIRQMRGSVYRSIEALYMRLKNTPYPFEHPNGNVSVGTVVIDIPPQRDDLAAVYNKGQIVLQGLDKLYARCMGMLARMGLDVEKALGMPPIMVPPGEEDNESDMTENE
ncbi:M48 family metallopeptidase [bacterium]|nr:M48 family metallopeptidase [bacterium]